MLYYGLDISTSIIGVSCFSAEGTYLWSKFVDLRKIDGILSKADIFKKWCDENNVPIIGIDNLPISKELESAQLPEKCVLFFGQEGAGMSDEATAVCETVLAIRQYGSTRSMNASAAAAIAMYAWAMQHLN